MVAKERTPRITIVGGSGFIGYALAQHLASTGKYEVRIADIRAPREAISSIEYVPCDVRDFSSLERAIKGSDVVINAAIIQIPAINECRRLAYEVNILGTLNVCKAVEECEVTRAMILTGTWHVFGDVELAGLVDEAFGYRPDKVEKRARIYALHKVGQEAIVRIYDEMSDKVFGVIRMGTVLGEDMPEKTAANIFISQALRGGPITPYKHSMHRPLFYTYVGDVCRAYESYIERVLNGTIDGAGSSLDKIVNVFYPEPMTILELAETVRDIVVEFTGGRVRPEVQVVDKGKRTLFSPEDKHRIKVNIGKALKLLGLNKLTSPREALRKIIERRLLQGGWRGAGKA